MSAEGSLSSDENIGFAMFCQFVSKPFDILKLRQWKVRKVGTNFPFTPKVAPPELELSPLFGWSKTWKNRVKLDFPFSSDKTVL